MREIRFRAWDKKGKRIVDNQSFGPGTEPVISFSGNCALHKLAKEVYEDKVREFILMQFTGLKDKNGKDIYEGDILEDDQNEILEVKFGKLPLDKSGDCVCTYIGFYCKCYGKLGRSPMHECTEIENWMKIIGNIYENPELLK